MGARDAPARAVAGSDNGIEDTAGGRGGHGGLEPLGAHARVVAVRAVENTHASPTRHTRTKVSRDRAPCYRLPKHGVFTQAGALFGGVTRLPHRMRRHRVRLDHS